MESSNYRYTDKEISVEIKSRLNVRYKLLWLVLFPFHVLNWVMFHEIVEKDVRDDLWNEHIWLDRLIDWHGEFNDWYIVQDELE